MEMDLVKATLVSGQPIFINTNKIESFYMCVNVCIIVLDSGNELRVKESFFNNLVKNEEAKK